MPDLPKTGRTPEGPRTHALRTVVARLALWCLAAALTATIAWASRMVLMSGGGLVLALFAALFLAVFVAPWPLFHLAVTYQARTSRAGRATCDPGRDGHDTPRPA